MSYETIEIQITDEGWAEVVFNRPDVLNALNLQMVNDLSAALDELAAEDGVRGLIFHGAGDRAFVAGADISELIDRKVDDALRAINAGLFQKLEDFPRPTIAAIRGYCLGGGSELALACDIRIGAGVGVRYLTGFGPLRLDVAVPLNPRPTDNFVAVYVSLGQAF